MEGPRILQLQGVAGESPTWMPGSHQVMHDAHPAFFSKHVMLLSWQQRDFMQLLPATEQCQFAHGARFKWTHGVLLGTGMREPSTEQSHGCGPSQSASRGWPGSQPQARHFAKDSFF